MKRFKRRLSKFDRSNNLFPAQGLKFYNCQEFICTMSDFYDKVYEVVRLIPVGKVTSYGAIAAYLGTAQSSRMVGWAMNNAHVQEKYVPAHRVVNRNGLLTGKHHFGSPTIMQELLEAEGITVIDDQIIDFESHFWNPMIELDME
jgi:methylated-DNA-protein-cysteine methyltransferase related protein